MPSIYERALGSDFQKLHPKIQQRFGFSSDGGVASIGSGCMEEIWRGHFYTLPFLYLGTWRRIMFPECGTNVPFTVENYAYRDGFGRETITWIRTFRGLRMRRFDAYMIYSETRGCIVDYLGTHQHLAVDLDLAADRRGGLSIRSDAQRFYEGPLGFTFPLCFSGVAEVREWYDDDEAKYRIEVEVTNRRWGRLFGYRGSFDAVWRKVEPGSVPNHVKPLREEQRE
ncbi:MAG: DUF4166 domain-containing protein [Planctomycetaceae bacterium]|nr:DUF4166 domain-containing protein [Planctomycetaceae bacterium]